MESISSLPRHKRLYRNHVTRIVLYPHVYPIMYNSLASLDLYRELQSPSGTNTEKKVLRK